MTRRSGGHRSAPPIACGARKELALWIARHANPRYKRRLLESPDPAVKDIGIAALSDRRWNTAYADIDPGAPAGQQESKAR